jgi:hypothetical protein
MIQKHRISTNIGVDQKITVEIKQDFDILEILSLKFSQQDIYTSMCSDYGVVCGRVTANNGFGVGNVRVSIFVPLTTDDENDPIISLLYPYKQTTDKDQNNYRYNLLPSRQQHGGHAATGTFPDQSDILTREEVLEVYEKYYRYTVKTNTAGDFMIWGVPTGAQTIHVDVDMSDIGCFSLRPNDFIRQGSGVDKFKNKYSFKASEDLNSLPQIISFDRIIQVYPFWGNESLCEIGITRTDFDLTEKGVNIQPKAYLIGGIFTDTAKNAVNKNCTPRKKMGRKCDMVPKSGKIEALRFTPQKNPITHRPYIEIVDLHEDIPDDGGFVLPLEMNMDYVFTNEFGENEITNDPNKGIPTSACYRMRINMNDNGLDRVRANADFLIPNIREYSNDVDRSYAFSTDYNDYPKSALPLITNNIGGEYYPQDYFYRFNYNKVYTVSSFHSHFIGSNQLGTVGFANINEAHPSEEEDCGDKLTPPTNFGKKNYTFTLLIADFLLILDYIIKLVVLSTLNILIKDILNPLAEGLITVSVFGLGDLGHSLRTWISNMQVDNTTKLSLINYPECVECSQNASNITAEDGCSLYNIVYDDSIITGVYVDNGSGGRTYKPTAGTNDRVVASLLAGNMSMNHVAFPPYSSSYDIRDIESGVWSRQPIPASHRSEFINGIFYVVPGTHTIEKLAKIINEYYRRKRVGKMFCGGIVNYGFVDNWLSGSLYFPQFKIKKLARAIKAKAEGIAHYCRSIAHLVVGQGRLYYKSASFDGNNFNPNNLNRPTTFVDLGPRDEFIKEICVDPTLDPNCSVSRSIGSTTYHDLGELLGLTINYRMETGGNSGELDMFFANKNFFTNNVLDGDILQLLSTNNETGIEGFDLENPRYIGYQFNILDPRQHPDFFKVGGDYGPIPVTLELNEDGYRIRTCLNEGTHYDFNVNLVKGRLTESSQHVPFYLWNKKGEGFGPSGSDRSNQAWDYMTPIHIENGNLQPLQGMTYAYNITGVPNNDSDQYVLLPMTNNNSGLTISNLNLTDQVEFETISNVDKTILEDGEYPGFTYLWVTGGTVNGITALGSHSGDTLASGVLYIRYGAAGTNGTDGWQKILWDTNYDVILPKRYDYYSGNKQILSTPFQFYFGLMAGKTGLDKFIDLFGPKGAFPPAE